VECFTKGCAHFRCGSCGLDRVVALSCKGRGFCPRCAGRRMTETARHLAERVVREVRTRQWVLSFPFQLCWALAFHHELVKSLARLTYAEIARRYLRLTRQEGVVSPRGAPSTRARRHQRADRRFARRQPRNE
jgi:hypothetical protein